MRIIKIFFVLEGILLILLPIMNLNSQEFLQQRYNFKLEKWKFHKGEIHSADSGGAIDETNWNEITVPHTWNAQDVLTDGHQLLPGNWLV